MTAQDMQERSNQDWVCKALGEAIMLEEGVADVLLDRP